MAGLIINVSEEGIQCLNGLADGIEGGVNSLSTLCSQFNDAFGQYPALGPHSVSILRMLKSILEETKNASVPAGQVAAKARKKAQDYREFLEDDLFGDAGDDSDPPAVPVKKLVRRYNEPDASKGFHR